VTRPGQVKLESARRLYELFAADLNPKKAPLPFDEVIAGSAQAGVQEQLQSIALYTSRIAATKKESESGHLFINGKHVPLGGVRHALSQLTAALDSYRPI
jgi:UDP-glucose:glycoprotein glucosyltransferase